MPKGTCSVVEDGKKCEAPVSCNGYCNMHNWRWRRTGDPLGLRGSARPYGLSVAERLARRLVPTVNGCLEFSGTRNRKGYGMMSNRGAIRGTPYTHRIAWEAANGPIPEGLFVLHHCDNPPCCNVDHLFLGTHLDNMADMTRKGRRLGVRRMP